MNEGSAGEAIFVQPPSSLPPTAGFIILCRRRCGLLPLHGGGDLVLQGPGPQQLHLPLGDSSGSKGKMKKKKGRGMTTNQSAGSFILFELRRGIGGANL